MTQIGQTLADLKDYDYGVNNPVISRVGSTGQYADVLNPPTRLGQFTNDKQYTIAGSNVGQFANDSQYITKGSSNNQLTNESNYAVRGEGVSNFGNDKGYSTLDQKDNPTAAVFSGPNVMIGQARSRFGAYKTLQTNIGLANFGNGLDAKSTNMIINHGLPVADDRQSYIGQAQAYCVDSGMDAGILTTIISVNPTYFTVKCMQFNNTGGTSTHGANDMSISWQMSLVEFGYRNQNNNPYPGAPPTFQGYGEPTFAEWFRYMYTGK